MIRFFLSFALHLPLAGTISAAERWQDLSEDTSRQTLFHDEVVPAKLAEQNGDPIAPTDFGIPRDFIFPDDAKYDKIEKKVRSGVLFGIDISHWTGDIKFKNMALQKVDFVYVKATQGTKFNDGMNRAGYAGGYLV